MKKKLETDLLAKKINPTAMRLLVLDFLRGQPHAVSLTEVERGLAPADRVTVYRTLKTFEEHGLVHAILDGKGIMKYAVCEDCGDSGHRDLHLHFSCRVCNETYCLPKSKVPDITIARGFIIEELQLTAKGICDKCTKQCNSVASDGDIPLS